MKLNIVDCTLRDGGYYCNWFFDKALVSKYLSAVSDANVDIVEIGFRFLPQKKVLGEFAYSKDSFLEGLALPSKINYAVMINASEYINHIDGIEKTVDSQFVNKKNSPVDIVRIASHAKHIEQCRFIAEKLKSLGYRVFLNLMQIDSIDSTSLLNIILNINGWESVEVFYFADSFGNMHSASIRNTAEIIKSAWDSEIGIHAHDNKGHALVNSLNAIENGVSYIDATLLGMGRGAGNTKMETLLVEVKESGVEGYNPDALYPIVLKDFSELKKKYNWGSSIYYYLSAVHSIHPTYVQEMLGDGRYDIDQILSAIDFLKSRSSVSFSLEGMIEAISNSSGSINGSWSVDNWAEGKDILIIGSGPGSLKYLNEISKYIKDNNPIVLCLNVNQNIPSDLITAYVACHETRITIELDLYLNLNKPIIMPLGRIPEEIKSLLKNVDIFDYGLNIEKDVFKSNNNGCTLEKPLVLMYSLALSAKSGANKILLSGLDGYEADNPKQQEMVALISNFINYHDNLEVFALTPTSYPIESFPVKKI
jgi:4-hydroxy 2-oxovalerate aldolase